MSEYVWLGPVLVCESLVRVRMGQSVVRNETAYLKCTEGFGLGVPFFPIRCRVKDMEERRRDVRVSL